jgi:hypothetical protein
MKYKSLIGEEHMYHFPSTLIVYDISCSLETKHDKITVPRSKMFVLSGRLQKQRLQPWKTVLNSNSSEVVFCTLETNDDRT